MSKTYLEYFEEICGIPHGSGNTSHIRDYVVSFAQSFNLDYYTDELNNVVIRKPATVGYEDHDIVVLQGHMDMVCEKEDGIQFDFLTDGLKLHTEGDFLMATGTTLGGDDGIAVAMMLSILSSSDVPHPALECVFTTDEETGMFGAAGIDASQITGRKLINIDSEDEGIFTVGCAGGARCEVVRECILEEDNECGALSIVVSGLMGGHSGVEINKGRQNSNVVLVDFLKELETNGIVYSLKSMNGGSKDNVITNKTECVILTKYLGHNYLQVVKMLADDFVLNTKVDTDPDLCIEVDEAFCTGTGLTVQETRTVVEMLSSYPNGVQKMSEDISGLPQTSLNFAVLKLEDSVLTLRFSVRSSVNCEKIALIESLENISKKYGARFSSDGHYPAWEYRKESQLRDIMVSVYESFYSQTPKIEVIHAGLECGLLSEKLPGLDAVSIGPDLLDIHTPKERMSLSSAQRVYEFVLETLKNI